MKKTVFFAAVLVLGVSTSLTLNAGGAAGQGPAGAGAAAAAQEGSHSLNPIKWAKKDAKNSDTAESRSNVEKKLTPNLQSQGLLAANSTATDACAPFTSLEMCLAVLHASHNLEVDFQCLRAEVTGVHISADMSGCKAADGEKTQSLTKAIHQLKADVNAKQAAKDAEQQTKDDLKAIGG